jgi:hypothetical protein
MSQQGFQAPMEDQVALRRGDRASVGIPAEAKIALGKWLRVQLLDVSTTGFRLNWTPEAQVGKHLLVRIASLGPLPATVKWQSASGAGCEFVHPLGDYIFEDLVRRAHGG